MFEKSVFFTETFSSQTASRFIAALSILLVLLLAQGPAYATEMLEADPDPDLITSGTTEMIVVDRLEEVDLNNLPPGNYLIVAIEENQTLEIQVQ